VTRPDGVPQYQGLNANEIVNVAYCYDSAWHVHKCLAWLDYVNRTSRHHCLRYAAIELRAGIELLWFEMLITSVGGALSAKDYARCSRDATKMYKLIDELTPGYEKLIEFTRIILAHEPNMPEIAPWDMSKLKRYHGEASKCLHFQGAPRDTFERDVWLTRSLAKLEKMAHYIWTEMTSHHGTGFILPKTMTPGVRLIWEQFRDRKIDGDSVKRQLDLV